MRLTWFVIATLAATGVAAASPESDRLFREGQQLRLAGKVAEACDAFARSQALEARVGTLLNLADCRERQGELSTAWMLFRKAMDLAITTRDPRSHEARRRAAALLPRIVDRIPPIVPPPMEPAAVEPAVEPAPVERPATPRATPADAAATATTASASRADRAAPAPTARVTAIDLPAFVQPVRPAHDDGPPLPAPAAAPAPIRALGAGLAVGTAEHGDLVIGARVIASRAVRGGALRGTGSILYARTQLASINALDDPQNFTQVYTAALGLDYVWRPSPRLAVAAGLGVGFDHLVVSIHQGSLTDGWSALRVSPIIVRLLDGNAELGAHLQLVLGSHDMSVRGVVALDVFAP